MRPSYDLESVDFENLPESYRTILSYWQKFKLQTQNEEKTAKDLEQS